MNKPFSELPEIFGPFVTNIRVPEYTSIPATENLLKLVDTKEMQRLRLIRQLGFVDLVFPGAYHTRFEHSLGVFNRAVQLVKHLCESESLLDVASVEQIRKMILGCMVHDLGHYHGAHVIEELGKIKEFSASLSQFNHLETGYRLLTARNSQLGRAIEDNYNIDRKTLADYIFRKKNGGGISGELYSILDGPIDVDKMDYLERDSIHTGVPYGRNYDASRLLNNFILLKQNNRYKIVLKEKGKAGAEVFIFSRYVMFTEVYWHHTARCFSAMFRRAFMDLVRIGISVEELIGKNLYHQSGCRYFGDRESFNSVMEMAKVGGRKTKVASELLQAVDLGRGGLYKRLLTLKPTRAPDGKLYDTKMISSRIFDTYTEGLDSWLSLCKAVADRVAKKAGLTNLNEHHILIDTPLKGDKGTTYPLYFPHEMVIRDITEVSPVAGALDKMFNEAAQQVRLYCHPSFAGKISSEQAYEALLECLV